MDTAIGSYRCKVHNFWFLHVSILSTALKDVSSKFRLYYYWIDYGRQCKRFNYERKIRP